MKQKQKKIQVFLLVIGFFLILFTYFYYPYISKVKVIENQTFQKDADDVLDNKQSTSFENVEYEGMTSAMQKFSVKSESAYILDKDPDLVFMKNMKVKIYLNDFRIVTIVSDYGRYHKESQDCWFEKNVIANDGETKIFAENLDLLATENFVKIYQQVEIFHPDGSLQADQVDYNFETKYFKVSMFDDKAIKMQVIK